MRKDWGKRGKRLEIYLHFNRNLSRERLKITFIGNFIDALVSIALQSSGIRVRNCNVINIRQFIEFLRRDKIEKKKKKEYYILTRVQLLRIIPIYRSNCVK